jgi:heptosyltransferase-2
MRILVINLSNIGDVILTTGVLEGLRFKFPQSQIDVLVGERAKDVFSKDVRVNEVIIYKKNAKLKEKISLFINLRKRKYQLIVDLRDTFFSYFLGGKLLKSKKIKAHRCLKHNTALRSLYTYDELKRLKPKLCWDKDEDEYITSLGFQKYIVISPIARSSTKSWPLEYFKILISHLSEYLPDYKILLVGEENERQALDELLIAENIINLAGKTTIPQLARLIKDAKLLITNDSATLHVASSLNTPTIAIFGPTSELKYGPLSERSLVLRRHLPCAPCEKAQCKYSNKRCLKDIKPEFVFQYIKEFLEGNVIRFRQDYKRILLVRTDKIGDLILTTPVIEVMRKNFPNAYLAFLCNANTKEILKNNPYLDEILTLDKRGKDKGILGSLRFIFKIRKKRFDLAIIFHPSKRVHLLLFLAGIPKRIGYDWKWGKLLNNVKVKHLKQLGERSEIEYNFDLLRPLGIQEVSYKQAIFIDPEAYKFMEKDLMRKGIDKFIIIHPGASCKSKTWPLDNFIRLAKKILEEGEFKIVFILGPYEEWMQGRIGKELKEGVFIYRNLDLKYLIPLISKCEAMISNDSGPMHIADAFSKPLIVIFGRKQPGLSYKRWGPVSKNAIIIHKDVGCKECLAHNCRRNFLCLRAIEVDEVFAKFKEMLERCSK